MTGVVREVIGIIAPLMKNESDDRCQNGDARSEEGVMEQVTVPRPLGRPDPGAFTRR